MQDINFKPKAFLFDLNGTIIDDMNYHSIAWHSILNNDLGKDISFEDVKKQMYGKNDELLVRVFGENHFTQEEIDRISLDKEKRYQESYLPHLALINGLGEFLAKAKEAGIKMAIGSAAIPFNVNFVLDGLNIRQYFDAIVSAQEVKISKPHPETFLNAAAFLGVEPADCLVFEDVPKGVESAANANMQSVVITTTHEIAEFSHQNNILAFINDYHDPILNSFL